MLMINDYRTVVVGADGSPLTVATVARAAGLAVHYDADLVLVAAWTPEAPHEVLSIGALKPAGGTAGARVHAQEAIEMAVAIADQFGAKVSAALLVDAEPGEALLEIAKRHDADLIVVGAIHDTSVSGRFLGTVATEVVRRATCEVLIVRPGRAEREEE
ncbi:MAG: universal stress protein [Propionibacteriaceae bacterium]|nr:universal stress protein [Propionibacteriaceae bacterium]